MTCDPMPASPRVRPLHLIVLGLILLAAALVRIKGISAEGLWIDELYSLEFSGGYGFPTDKLLPRNTVIESPPLLTSLHGAPATWRIWTTLGDDIHPPLYYIVLRIWREMFGSSDVAIRSLSVLASLVAIVLLFDLGRLLFSLGAGLWAALLMAIAQPQIWYAQEARGYLMATALTLGAAGALVRIEQRGFTRARAVALGLCLLVSVLTHYASAATGLALASYALIRLRGRRRWQVLGVLAASALVFLVIWGPFLLQQPRGASFASPIFHEPRTDAVTPLLKRLIILPMTFFSRPPGPTEYAAALAWVLLLLPLIFLRRRPQLLLATLWAAFWIGIPALTDLIRHMRLLEQFRYVLGAAPALYLLAAGLLSDRGRWFAHLLPLGFGLTARFRSRGRMHSTRASGRNSGTTPHLGSTAVTWSSSPPPPSATGTRRSWSWMCSTMRPSCVAQSPSSPNRRRHK
jgi:4-amino-4-deoxy-L-arabinose transferase-like glycosyltransferase